MPFQYQMMATPWGQEGLGGMTDLDASDLEGAKKDARTRFVTARRMARSGGQKQPESVRILEYEVELWRWNWTQEADAVRQVGR